MDTPKLRFNLRLLAQTIRSPETRGIIKNVAYFAMFLLIRYILICYLEKFRASLKERVREEFIVLKKTFFSVDQGDLFWHQQDYDDDNDDDDHLGQPAALGQDH